MALQDPAETSKEKQQNNRKPGDGSHATHTVTAAIQPPEFHAPGLAQATQPPQSEASGGSLDYPSLPPIPMLVSSNSSWSTETEIIIETETQTEAQTEAEAEAEVEDDADVEFGREDINPTQGSNGLALAHPQNGMDFGSPALSSISSKLAASLGGDNSPPTFFVFGNNLGFFDASPTRTIEGTDLSAILWEARQKEVQNTLNTYICWQLGLLGELDPHNLWSEPEKRNMKSTLTPALLQEEDLEKKGYLRCWYNGFDTQLFAQSLRLYPSQRALFVPYRLRGTNITYKAYHDPINAWIRRKSAANTLKEQLDPSSITAALSPEFDQLATAFFNGEKVPKNFDTPQNDVQAYPECTAQPATKNVHYKINYITLWGRVVETQWLLEPVLSTFLIDVIMANEMEQSILSARNYCEVKVNRHPKYDEFRGSINLDPEVSTDPGNPPELDKEANVDNDDIRSVTPEIFTASELPELANPIKPQSSKLSEKAKKKKKTKAKVKAPTKINSTSDDSTEEDPFMATTTSEDTRKRPGSTTENSPKSRPVPSPVPSESGTFFMSTFNPYAKSGDRMEDDAGPEWTTISNSSQRIKRKNRPNPIPDFSQGVSNSADRGRQSYPGTGSSQAGPPRKQAQTSSIPQKQTTKPQSARGQSANMHRTQNSQSRTNVTQVGISLKQATHTASTPQKQPSNPRGTVTTPFEMLSKPTQSIVAIPSVLQNAKHRALDLVDYPALFSKVPTSAVTPTRDYSLDYQTETSQPTDTIEARYRAESTSNLVHIKDQTRHLDTTLASNADFASASATYALYKDTVASYPDNLTDNLKAKLSSTFEPHHDAVVQRHESQSSVSTEAPNNDIITCDHDTNVAVTVVEKSPSDHDTAKYEDYEDNAPILSLALVGDQALPGLKQAVGVNIVEKDDEEPTRRSVVDLAVRPRRSQSAPQKPSTIKLSDILTSAGLDDSIEVTSDTVETPVPTDDGVASCPVIPSVVSSQPSLKKAAIHLEPVPEQELEEEHAGQSHADSHSSYPGSDYPISDGACAIVSSGPSPALSPPEQLPQHSLAPPPVNDSRRAPGAEHISLSHDSHVLPTIDGPIMNTASGYFHNQYPDTRQYDNPPLTMGNQPPTKGSQSLADLQPPSGPGSALFIHQTPYSSHPDINLPTIVPTIPVNVSTPTDSGYQSCMGDRTKNNSDMRNTCSNTTGDAAGRCGNNLEKSGSDKSNQEKQGARLEGTKYTTDGAGYDQQGGSLEGVEADHTILATQQSVNESLVPSESPADRVANPTQVFQASIVGCTFCTRDCPKTLERPAILCPGCGPTGNIRYCSQACILGDAYGHAVRCLMYPASQRFGPQDYPPQYVYFQNPIMHKHYPFKESREKFRQKTFMMCCSEGAFPQILKAWGRRASNTIPAGVDIEETGKRTGSYFVFKSTATAPLIHPSKIYMPGIQQSYDRFNHGADVIFVVTLPHGKEQDFLSRALNCCFFDDNYTVKASLFRMIRHYICDEKRFSEMKHEEPREIVLREFEQQFEKEFTFDVAAFYKEGHSFWGVDDEWKRCGMPILILERQSSALEKWKRPGWRNPLTQIVSTPH